MDTELDQVINTVLSLEEDYPAMSPPPRDQDHPSSTCSTFTDFRTLMESQESAYNATILQQIVRELCSTLLNQQESQTIKTMDPIFAKHITEKSSSKDTTEKSLNNPIKRKFCEEENYGCKKPRVEAENCLTIPSRAPSRKKTIYNKEQTTFLHNQFNDNPYPDYVTRCRIAQITGIPEPRIQVWFQNRRARHLCRTRSL
ncbi:homeobox protein siamois-like [Mixophyes fleayi]|uniref:homeobox protein siamois-like n=1 Tax=Mixophyes fleayi TaxID=3061075 RepID=UPI003F4E40AA